MYKKGICMFFNCQNQRYFFFLTIQWVNLKLNTDFFPAVLFFFIKFETQLHLLNFFLITRNINNYNHSFNSKTVFKLYKFEFHRILVV